MSYFALARVRWCTASNAPPAVTHSHSTSGNNLSNPTTLKCWHFCSYTRLRLSFRGRFTDRFHGLFS